MDLNNSNEFSNPSSQQILQSNSSTIENIITKPINNREILQDRINRNSKVSGKQARYYDKKKARQSHRARRWTVTEQETFKRGLERYGRDWKRISEMDGIIDRPKTSVSSHAQSYFIKLWRVGAPLPDKVKQTGEGYTLSGKPLDPNSASVLRNRSRKSQAIINPQSNIANIAKTLKSLKNRKKRSRNRRSRRQHSPIKPPLDAELAQQHKNCAREIQKYCPAILKYINVENRYCCYTSVSNEMSRADGLDGRVCKNSIHTKNKHKRNRKNRNSYKRKIGVSYSYPMQLEGFSSNSGAIKYLAPISVRVSGMTQFNCRFKDINFKMWFNHIWFTPHHILQHLVHKNIDFYSRSPFHALRAAPDKYGKHNKDNIYNNSENNDTFGGTIRPTNIGKCNINNINNISRLIEEDQHYMSHTYNTMCLPDVNMQLLSHRQFHVVYFSTQKQCTSLTNKMLKKWGLVSGDIRRQIYKDKNGKYLVVNNLSDMFKDICNQTNETMKPGVFLIHFKYNPCIGIQTFTIGKASLDEVLNTSDIVLCIRFINASTYLTKHQKQFNEKIKDAKKKGKILIRHKKRKRAHVKKEEEIIDIFSDNPSGPSPKRRKMNNNNNCNNNTNNNNNNYYNNNNYNLRSRSRSRSRSRHRRRDIETKVKELRIPFQCDVCKQSFQNEQQVKEHKFMIHTLALDSHTMKNIPQHIIKRVNNSINSLNTVLSFNNPDNNNNNINLLRTTQPTQQIHYFNRQYQIITNNIINIFAPTNITNISNVLLTNSSQSNFSLVNNNSLNNNPINVHVNSNALKIPPIQQSNTNTNNNYNNNPFGNPFVDPFVDPLLPIRPNISTQIDLTINNSDSSNEINDEINEINEMKELQSIATKRLNVKIELVVGYDTFTNELRVSGQTLLNSIVEYFSDYINNTLKQYNNTQCPFYSIYTRDCFDCPLHKTSTKQVIKDRQFTKQEYFMQQSINGLSKDYIWWLNNNNNDDDDNNKRDRMICGKKCVLIGAVAYHDLFTEQELLDMESVLDRLQERAQTDNHTFKYTSQGTVSRSGILVRTKHFFGARYLWHPIDYKREGPRDKKIGAGLRVDVDQIPKELFELCEKKLVQYGIIPADWIQGIAFNMYHDGSEGLGPHFDDIARFDRPIITIRLFSDARIAFGTDLYGTSNGVFSIPLPRGCVLKLQKNGFAADGVKHTVRSLDMYDKSAAIILRRFQQNALNEARQLHETRINNGYYDNIDNINENLQNFSSVVYGKQLNTNSNSNSNNNTKNMNKYIQDGFCVGDDDDDDVINQLKSEKLQNKLNKLNVL